MENGSKGYRSLLVEGLADYEPFDATEAAHLRALIQFLDRCSRPFSRETPEGHVTGSAILLDKDRERALLLWHEKLRRWLQPGGHTEAVDVSPQTTALRELVEETGIPEPALNLVKDKVFDVDVHLIAARETTGAHFHYDLRFLFRLVDGFDSQAHGFRWVDFEALAGMEDESLSRLGRKLRLGGA
ncbi:MAG: NUDIX domain-containing protein [Acidobacteria bacterium]|nr:NUDIX domain-containing protein [Acidobacteriota bacterium]